MGEDVLHNTVFIVVEVDGRWIIIIANHCVHLRDLDACVLSHTRSINSDFSLVDRLVESGHIVDLVVLAYFQEMRTSLGLGPVPHLERLLVDGGVVLAFKHGWKSRVIIDLSLEKLITPF